MDRKQRKRVSAGTRIFIMAVSLSLVFMMLFGIYSYFIIRGNAVSVIRENVGGVFLALIAAAIAGSLLLGLGMTYGVERLLSFLLKRLVTDMQQICEGGQLNFAARKHKKDDPIGMVYEYYAKVVGVTDELLAEINQISQKRKEGETSVRIDEKKYRGAYYGAAQNVNTMMDIGDYKNRIRIV